VLYSARDNQLFTIDTVTGAATPLVNITATGLGQITAMAIDSAGTIFVTNIGGVNLYTVNPANGIATLRGTLGGANNWYTDLAFDPSGVLYGARRDGGVFIIDTVNATEQLVFFGTYTGLTFCGAAAAPCYPNCDGSTVAPILNVEDFTCFINEFANAQSLPHQQQLTHYANCDQSTTPPVLNVEDFTCFINAFAQGCN
jgi:hypothetical protein